MIRRRMRAVVIMPEEMNGLLANLGPHERVAASVPILASVQNSLVHVLRLQVLIEEEVDDWR